MKLDLGVGNKPREPGFTTVDRVAQFEPDVVWDLEVFPWPWEDDSVDEIRMVHVLEHLGQAPEVFLRVVGEIHRVLVPGGTIKIVVPHPRSDVYFGNYQHVRPVTQLMMQQFSRKNGWSPDIYAMTGIDMEIVEVTNVLMRHWAAALAEGRVTEVEVRNAERDLYNVVEEIHLTMRKVP